MNLSLAGSLVMAKPPNWTWITPLQAIVVALIGIIPALVTYYATISHAESVSSRVVVEPGPPPSSLRAHNVKPAPALSPDILSRALAKFLREANPNPATATRVFQFEMEAIPPTQPFTAAISLGPCTAITGAFFLEARLPTGEKAGEPLVQLTPLVPDLSKNPLQINIPKSSAPSFLMFIASITGPEPCKSSDYLKANTTLKILS
jgi:hypothetical protein